jgi:membrane protein
MSDAVHQFGRFLLHLYRRLNDDRCLQLASSLTYTSLLALVPLITVALTVISAFPAFGQFTNEVHNFIAKNVLPQAISNVITRYLEDFASKAAGLTAIGLAALGVTAFLLMYTIERAFNTIWRVRHPRPVMQRFLMYWAALTLGPALMGVSLTTTTYVLSLSLGWTHDLPILGETALKLVPPVFTIAAFTLLYFVVPNRPIKVLHALIGGLVAGVLFEVMKRGFALYVALTPTYTIVYGTFATIPVFLVWIYASWVVTALGAEVTALLPDYKLLRDDRRRIPGMGFRDALEILRVLLQYQGRAHLPDAGEISRRARVPWQTCETILEILEDAGWVGRVAGWRWALVCDPTRVRIADVYRLFVIAPDLLRERTAATALLRDLLDTIDSNIDRAMALPIKALHDYEALESQRAKPAEIPGKAYEVSEGEESRLSQDADLRS